MTSSFADIIVKYFWRWCVFLVEFSYWSMFHVNIKTGSGVITIFVYKWLTRNSETGNTPVWLLPNIWRLEWVRNTKFGTNSSNKKLLNTVECQGYSFYPISELLRKNQQGAELAPHPDIIQRETGWLCQRTQ